MSRLLTRCPTLALLTALAACSDGGRSGLSGSSSLTLGEGGSDGFDSFDSNDDVDDSGSTQGSSSDSSDSSDSSSAETLDGSSSSGDGLPPAIDCEMRSTTFGQNMQILDAPVGSSQRLGFQIFGLPSPGLIESATLDFASYDADHPGEEGEIYVNGAGPYDLPANAGWDNMFGTGSVDVSGTTIEGLNSVEFGPGSFAPSSWYHIGDVALTISVHLEACPDDGPPPPDPNAVEREIWYDEAAYTQAHNWVQRCTPGLEYAFTAYGDEHLQTDCSGLYNPDGSRTGTAIFAFPGVVASTYEIQIHSRHTVNRNPMGALVVVDGEGKRIPQNDDQDMVTDLWGTKFLSGDVEIVLDSTMENASDSVTWVKIVPFGG